MFATNYTNCQESADVIRAILFNKTRLAALRTAAYPPRPLLLNRLNRRERGEYAEAPRGNSCGSKMLFYGRAAIRSKSLYPAEVIKYQEWITAL